MENAAGFDCRLSWSLAHVHNRPVRLVLKKKRLAFQTHEETITQA